MSGWLLSVEPYDREISAKEVNFQRMSMEELQLREETKPYPPKLELKIIGSSVAENSHAGRWKDLGISLRVHPSDQDTIQSANPHSSSDCLREMLLLWLRQRYDSTWRKLARADRTGGNNHALAHEIARKHTVLLSPPPNSSTATTGTQTTHPGIDTGDNSTVF